MITIKRVLCPLYGAPSDRVALRMALGLARRFSAQADMLFVRPNPADALPYLGEGISGPVIEDIIETARKAADEAEKAARAAAAEEAANAGVPESEKGAPDRPTMRVRTRTGRAPDVVAEESRLADLVIAADASARDQASGPNALEACMLGEGRPVMLVPEAVPDAIGTHAVIGWDGSREAAHAVTAALPFLKEARRVTILCIDEDGVPDAPVANALAEYLALHGISAEIRLVAEDERGTGELLLDEVKAVGGDLLVMGGYSHSRLRELVLGGVTRYIRSHATIPVLMAH